MSKPYTWSILLRNFNPKASKTKAKTTFIELSQAPDRGNLFKAEGKIASIVNGAAKANPKKNIPTSGLIPPPCTASIIKAPINGPVQEKETITVVSAIKKAPTNPPLSAFASVLLTKLLGKTISNAPKNEIAKTRKRIKNRRLGIQCVLKILPTFGPKTPSENSAPSNVKIEIIESPKKIPVLIDFALFSLPRIKNDTVIGIIGKTQGVKTAANPAIAEIRIKSQIV